MADEFSLIARYFAPFAPRIGDDCATLELDDGEILATSIDTLVEGTHFFSDAPPEQVGYRAVVVALSDLAAMGADPRAITLALTLPEADETWVRQFARGVERATGDYDVELIGGDTTRGPLTISVQVMGALRENEGIHRGSAQVGDKVFISGPTGDAAAALTVMAGEWPGHLQHKEYLLRRFYQPTARTELGMQLQGIASSAIDISDGLLADAQHICDESDVGIRIDSQAIPLSAALESVPDHDVALTWALTGGDDYELLFTVPADRQDQVPEGCTPIGEVTEGSRAEVDFDVVSLGFVHFAGGPAEGVAASAHSAETADASTESGEAMESSEPKPFRSLSQFMAFGFGSGLSPKAPGTAGTVVAIPIYLLACELGLVGYSLFVLAACLFGVWVCGKASKELGVHDHPGIVWDEFAGYWITMWALPTSWFTVISGFALFRFFDVLKPWPIRFYDRNLEGGLGIMLDDILAGVFSCAILHGILFALGTPSF